MGYCRPFCRALSLFLFATPAMTNSSTMVAGKHDVEGLLASGQITFDLGSGESGPEPARAVPVIYVHVDMTSLSTWQTTVLCQVVHRYPS